ncbi:fatty acid desaturase-domain-containing protein [Neohortaea acidophila]|uniref:Delta 8-(E)-sphingolipid desaturase n=1 Tax=Neohortaea acidophila TaxID=245834 RepID=A0A6A6Q5S7_9PEZI|nr:fatty acid desaturase-domain-containing protein [Neohortaea acidophila]KAF2487306.1 fatty acid desaturase-domain-containing protein [Neohortaea acidophila]
MATTAPNRTRQREAVITRGQIARLIAEGRKVVIVEGRVLKVDAWLPFHPGGDKAILHMVGRDATNEVRAFHSAETQHFMHRYQIGRVEGQWKDFVPPIQGGTVSQLDEGSETAEENGDITHVDHDSSEEEHSQEPSPLFDPAERPTTSLKRRNPRPRTASESSATSLDTLELDPSALPNEKDSQLATDPTQRDIEIFPSLDPLTQQSIIEKYRQLDDRIRAAGLYNCNYTAYLYEFMRYATLALLSYYFLRQQSFSLSAICLGLLWHQLVFTVHDAGHMGITHNFHIDTCIGILISDFIGGLSVCWWKRNHNVHHIVTNSAEHDPDIQHMPFFAISPRFFESLRSTYYDRIMTYDAFARFTLRYQHFLYYPILLFGRFNLYVLSWQYIFLGQGPRKGPAWWHRYLEVAGQLFFWYWFGYLVCYKSIPTAGQRVGFILLSHMITMPVHVQITLSHFAMSTSDLGVAESFPQRMLRTTMDVDCPPWLDFVHGGLQFQAVHHLFPRVPRHNLRKGQGMVREFCEEVGIPYAIYGFTKGNAMVIGRLGEIAKQARIFADCQRSMTVKDALEGH